MGRSEGGGGGFRVWILEIELSKWRAIVPRKMTHLYDEARRPSFIELIFIVLLSSVISNLVLHNT